MLYLIHDTTTGEAISSSTTYVEPDSGQTSVEISDFDKQGLYDGWMKWDSASRTVVVDPSFPNQNMATLKQRAQAALAANQAFLDTVANRRQAIATGKATATAGKTATVSNVAQAQSQIRSIWGVLEQVATALSDSNDQMEMLTKESTTVIQLMLGLFDSVPDV